jgi:hypothetical protein
MDPLHELVTRIGLAATGRYGFALAGGYAVQAHGFLNRVSEDVDLFTVNEARAPFQEAVTAAVDAYRSEGFSVETTTAEQKCVISSMWRRFSEAAATQLTICCASPPSSMRDSAGWVIPAFFATSA